MLFSFEILFGVQIFKTILIAHLKPKAIKRASDLSAVSVQDVLLLCVMDSSVYWIFTKCDPSSVLMLRFDNFQYALLSVLFVVVQCIVIALMVR